MAGIILLVGAASCLTGVSGVTYYQLNHKRKNAAQTTDQKKIEKIYEAALDDMGIKNAPKLVFSDQEESLKAFGHCLFGTSRIVINPQFAKNTNGFALRFLFRQQLAHIQKNHLIKIPLYTFLAGLIPLIAGVILSAYNIDFGSSSALVALSVLSTALFAICYSKRAKKEAINLAIEKGWMSPTDPRARLFVKELTETIQVLENNLKDMQGKKKALKDENNWRHHLISENGENVLNLFQPSISSNIITLKNVLERELTSEYRYCRSEDEHSHKYERDPNETLSPLEKRSKEHYYEKDPFPLPI